MLNSNYNIGPTGDIPNIPTPQPTGTSNIADRSVPPDPPSLPTTHSNPNLIDVKSLLSSETKPTNALITTLNAASGKPLNSAEQVTHDRTVATVKTALEG